MNTAKEKKGIRMTNIMVRRISLTEAPANQKQFLALKNKGDFKMTEIKVPEKQQEVIKALLEDSTEPALKSGNEFLKAAALLFKKAAASKEDVEAFLKAVEVEQPKPEAERLPVKKSDGTYNLDAAQNEEQKKMFAEFNKSLEDNRRQIAELRKAQKAAEDKIVIAEITKSVEAFKAGGDKAELVTLLKSVKDADAKLYDGVLKAFETFNKAIDASALFGEAGSSNSESGDAHKKLEGIAADIKKTMPTMSDHAAFRKACEANPELYKQSKKG